MKKLFFILFLLIPLLSFSQTYQTVQSGEWTDPCTWSVSCDPNSIPPYDGTLNNFTIIINTGHSVTLEGNFIFKNQLTLIVCGSLHVTKDMGETGDLVGNGLDLEVCCGGELIVEGSLKLKNIGRLNINGTFIVDGIYGHQENSGNCIYTTEPECDGVIITPNGEEPPIQNFLFGGDDPDDKCQGSTPILPIELLSFTLTPRIDHVLVQWVTGSEINNDYFTILRSKDLQYWETLHVISGAGNSSIPLSYSFKDYAPHAGINYYRLKQTDFDGNQEIFYPIAIEWKFDKVKVYSWGETTVLIAPEHVGWNLWVMDAQGRSLYKNKILSDRTFLNLEGNLLFFIIFNEYEKTNIIHIKHN